MRRSPLLFLLLVFSSLGLTACGEKPLPPPLPAGEQTVSGVLLPAEISLLRRGTHVLRVQGKETYFVESSVVNLRSLEQREVVLKGTLEENTDPEMLPVLVVRELVSSVDRTRAWDLPSLGLSFRAPLSWKMTEEGRQVQFSLEGQEKPILILSKEKCEEFPPPPGVPDVIAGYRAERTGNAENGDERMEVLVEGTLYTFLFTPGNTEKTSELTSDLRGVFASLAFHRGGSGSSMSSQQTGSGAGIPCGGPAGILCPAGQYCSITDFQENIGHCRPVR
ncbi:MAG: hypothetical protein PHI23_01000 [Candidatus Peribacteraceae bacterium]|nr:hypothetical protein [Candidatus Peribacteraceae bacterium]